MPKRLNQVKVPLGEKLENVLGWLHPGYSDFRVLRESVDARRRHDVHKLYAVDIYAPGESSTDTPLTLPRLNNQIRPVIVVGAGPAGLFAALRLSERGIPTILFEQGSAAEKRVIKINRFWRYGELDPRNNVGFGEGGAGLYSDGKLITRIKSPHIPYVMQRLVDFGAPKEIRYLANPHVGSDRIRRIIPRIREALLKSGCEIHFDVKVDEISFSGTQVCGVQTDKGFFGADRVVLATGHSAEDMLHRLHAQGVLLEGKSFAVGLRIEHPQSLIDKIQYRDQAGHPDLGAANYKLSYHDHEQNYGVYSFCMCPGGYVLSSATEPGRMLVNGMSNFKRNSGFANSAIVVSVDHAKEFGSDIFAGLKFRQQLEESALQMAQAHGPTHAVPAQTLENFLGAASGPVRPSSSLSGVTAARVDQLFSIHHRERLIKGLESFLAKMPNFAREAQFHAVESRTSCPVRVTRDDETLQSLSHQGLYPCGEGAGYAGGITSAACDGVRIADRIYQEEATSVTQEPNMDLASHQHNYSP